MERAFTVSSRVLLAALFLLVVFQAASRALTIDEATVWDHLVHGSFRSAFIAPDAWNGLVYAILAKRAIGLFRLSELTMRLPAVLAGAIYLVVLTRHMRPPIAVLLAVPPMALGWFSTATPHGVALVLVLCAAVSLRVERRAVLFGLAIATSPIFAVPLAALAIYGALGQGFPIVERVVIPAVTTAFILLIIPLSHAAPGSRTWVARREEHVLRDSLRSLRNRGPLRIAAAAPVLPLLEFYRAAYRQRDWQVVERDPQYRLGVSGSLENTDML